MKIGKAFVAAALLMLPTHFAPAVAQDYDAVYECYIGCIASRPDNLDWCAAECNRRFGNEQSGGGEPGGYGPYSPGRQCWGSFNECNPTQ